MSKVTILITALCANFVAGYNETAISDESSYDDRVRWVDASNGYVPRDTVAGGYIQSRNEVNYVCRARYDDNLLPGRLVTRLGGCVVTLNGEYKTVSRYQAMRAPRRASPQWIKRSHGEVPNCANPIGRSALGNELYTGRLYPGGGINDYILGMINPRNGVFYWASVNGEEKSDYYEALCVRDYFENENSTFDI